MPTHMRDGTTVDDLRLGRLHDPDPGDQRYLLADQLPTAPPPRRWRYWWPSGWWGDQHTQPWCVAYAWLHWLADGPSAATPAPSLPPAALYCTAQQLDPWPGDCHTPPTYGGTSVRAGAQALQQAGLIGGYRWAWDIETTINCLLQAGPVVAGTSWRSGMSTLDPDGYIHATGLTVGGHAYLLNGINLDRAAVRVKNSWGRSWGRGGHAWLPIADLALLLDHDGEVCLPDPPG